MPRSNNLDNVAPDDDFLPKPEPQKVTPPPEPKPEPPPEPSNPAPEPKTPQSSSSAQQMRQKIYDLIGHTKHPFSAFLARPKVFSFEEKDEEEEILLVLRQHWFTNTGWILTALAMSLLPLFFGIVPVFGSLPSSYLAVATIFWYLITFAFAFEKFLSWYFNVFIITDERVIDIDFNNLLSKRFSEAKLSMIQDVTSQVTGIYQTMFNYGTILIQTAAEIPEIQFERVPNPQTVIKILQQLRTEEEQEALEGRIR